MLELSIRRGNPVPTAAAALATSTCHWELGSAILHVQAQAPPPSPPGETPEPPRAVLGRLT